MSLNDRLKSIDCIRRIVKKIKIYIEYGHDAVSFNKFYMEKSDKKKNYNYRMLMLVHNLEKGMCMPKLRPFGQDKVIKLIHMVNTCEEQNNIEISSYRMAISIVFKWVEFYKEQGWIIPGDTEITSFLDKHKEIEKCEVGYKIYERKDLLVDVNPKFEEVLTTRKSVRNFKDSLIRDNDVQYCIKMSQCAPTACNRQMVSIIQVSDRGKCDLITDTIYGSAGISRHTVTYFVVTFDLNALDYYGERNQGYLNAGLVAMNFVNALHSKNIGSCFLQWANCFNEDKYVRKELGISEHERIAVVIAAGYYDENSIVAKSCRRNINEIYRKV